MMVPPPEGEEEGGVLETHSPVSFFHTFKQKHYVKSIKYTVVDILIKCTLHMCNSLTIKLFPHLHAKLCEKI
jgi:hypothetical protein